MNEHHIKAYGHSANSFDDQYGKEPYHTNPLEHSTKDVNDKKISKHSTDILDDLYIKLLENSKSTSGGQNLKPPEHTEDFLDEQYIKSLQQKKNTFNGQDFKSLVYDANVLNEQDIKATEHDLDVLDSQYSKEPEGNANLLDKQYSKEPEGNANLLDAHYSKEPEGNANLLDKQYSKEPEGNANLLDKQYSKEPEGNANLLDKQRMKTPERKADFLDEQLDKQDIKAAEYTTELLDEQYRKSLARNKHVLNEHVLKNHVLNERKIKQQNIRQALLNAMIKMKVFKQTKSMNKAPTSLDYDDYFLDNQMERERDEGPSLDDRINQSLQNSYEIEESKSPATRSKQFHDLLMKFRKAMSPTPPTSHNVEEYRLIGKIVAQKPMITSYHHLQYITTKGSGRGSDPSGTVQLIRPTSSQLYDMTSPTIATIYTTNVSGEEFNRTHNNVTHAGKEKSPPLNNMLKDLDDSENHENNTILPPTTTNTEPSPVDDMKFVDLVHFLKANITVSANDMKSNKSEEHPLKPNSSMPGESSLSSESLFDIFNAKKVLGDENDNLNSSRNQLGSAIYTRYKLHGHLSNNAGYTIHGSDVHLFNQLSNNSIRNMTQSNVGIYLNDLNSENDYNQLGENMTRSGTKSCVDDFKRTNASMAAHVCSDNNNNGVDVNSLSQNASLMQNNYTGGTNFNTSGVNPLNFTQIQNTTQMVNSVNGRETNKSVATNLINSTYSLPADFENLLRENESEIKTAVNGNISSEDNSYLITMNNTTANNTTLNKHSYIINIKHVRHEGKEFKNTLNTTNVLDGSINTTSDENVYINNIGHTHEGKTLNITTKTKNSGIVTDNSNLNEYAFARNTSNTMSENKQSEPTSNTNEHLATIGNNTLGEYAFARNTSNTMSENKKSEPTSNTNEHLATIGNNTLGEYAFARNTSQITSKENEVKTTTKAIIYFAALDNILSSSLNFIIPKEVEDKLKTKNRKYLAAIDNVTFTEYAYATNTSDNMPVEKAKDSPTESIKNTAPLSKTPFYVHINIINNTSTKPNFITTSTKPKFITTSTKPEFITTSTKPEFITTSTKPEFITTSTKPEFITTSTKPEFITTSTKPEFITTKPKFITTSTKPEFITTKPKFITASTKPEFITTSTKPEFITTSTKPEFITTSTKPEFITTKPKFITTSTKPEFITTSTKPEFIHLYQT